MENIDTFNFTNMNLRRVTGGAWCQPYYSDLKDYNLPIWDRGFLDAPEFLLAGSVKWDKYNQVVDPSYICRYF